MPTIVIFIFLGCWLALNGVSAFVLIGRERKPVTAGLAVFINLINLLLFWGIYTLATRAGM
jgi:hypothetical protein